MTKMYKRVLALLMALVLMFSCTAFASATTPESATSEFTFETASEGGIMPLAENHVIYQQLNQTTGKISFSFIATGSYQFYWTTSSTTDVKISFYRSTGTGGVLERTGRCPSTNGNTQSFSLGTVPHAGVYTVDIEPTSGNGGWYIGVFSAIY